MLHSWFMQVQFYDEACVYDINVRFVERIKRL